MSLSTTIIPRDEHNISRSMIDENCLKVLYRLRRNGFKAYLVGGSVRDLLLGRQPKDFDVGTDATPEQVRKLFRNCRLVGRRFRLAHIMFGRNNLIEVATFRRKPRTEELDAADNERFFAENLFGTPQQDAFRRDFTINALFYDINNFSIIDHVGGLTDLKNGVIRVIGDPDERFNEDPVRMLRALEFSARLGFSLHDDIPAAIERNAASLIGAAPARMREEIMELFRHKVAGKVLQKAEHLHLAEFIIPGYAPQRANFDLLRQLDIRTASGVKVTEPFALAVLYLPQFCARCHNDMNIGEVHKLATSQLSGHCRYFSIASGIRHQARELFIAFFRLRRGRGRRGEQRFLRHPAAAEGLELYRLWCAATGSDKELLESWQLAMNDREAPPSTAPARKRRPRRRRRRRQPPQNVAKE